MVGCTRSKGTTSVNTTNHQVVDSLSILADKNFKYPKISDTRTFFRDLKTHKILLGKHGLVELNKQQKMQLIADIISKDLNASNKENDLTDLIQAYFVSKQDKVAGFQPIILYLTGDDYQALKLIVLDANNKLVDNYNLYGGFNAGPYSQGDTLTIEPTEVYALIDKKQFITYCSTLSYPTDTLKKNSILDSDVYRSTIASTGRISTTQTAKIRRIIRSLSQHH